MPLEAQKPHKLDKTSFSAWQLSHWCWWKILQGYYAQWNCPLKNICQFVYISLKSMIVLAFDEWNPIYLWMLSTFVQNAKYSLFFLISFEFYNKSVTTFLICSLLTMFFHRPKLFYLVFHLCPSLTLYLCLFVNLSTIHFKTLSLSPCDSALQPFICFYLMSLLHNRFKTLPYICPFFPILAIMYLNALAEKKKRMNTDKTQVHRVLLVVMVNSPSEQVFY